jgi:hypothetical protein
MMSAGFGLSHVAAITIQRIRKVKKEIACLRVELSFLFEQVRNVFRIARAALFVH